MFIFILLLGAPSNLSMQSEGEVNASPTKALSDVETKPDAVSSLSIGRKDCL